MPVPAPAGEGSALTVPAPAAAPVSPTAPAETYRRERSATADASAPLGQEAPSSPDPDAWAARIEVLHAAGETDEAVRELRAFRAVDPHADEYLPHALRDWARTVEPFPPAPGR